MSDFGEVRPGGAEAAGRNDWIGSAGDAIWERGVEVEVRSTGCFAPIENQRGRGRFKLCSIRATGKLRFPILREALSDDFSPLPLVFDQLFKDVAIPDR